ncbi:T9SS type A sorting domain-containing protein [Flavobacterium granuli]|uniref:Secretion system C-terminal sorting domain-containing protein n=1 Tax=Flavobacterium granuli TaxID=280093 RepID=A0ABU1S2R4_9FLAO|nr:T9SS type A sorting domain-containing protein [Flavobacterium granuli]MDR6845313.1 hypothetical protein [Flavobacterium granuli]
MKHPLLLFSLLLFQFCTYGQNLHHQMLSIQGTSVTLPNGMYVSQTVGQQSPIGTYSKDGTVYGQGFQQGLWGKYISSNNINSTNQITTLTYPNPFVSTINFQFSEPITDLISIRVFDISGRLILNQTQRTDSNLLTVDMSRLAESNYLVQLSAPNFTYYTQILRKK